MTTPRVTVPVEPTPLSVCQAIAPYLGATDQNDWRGLDDDDAISMPVKMRVGDLRALKSVLSAALAIREEAPAGAGEAPEPPAHLSSEAAYGWSCGYEAALRAQPQAREDYSSLIAARCLALPGKLVDCPVCGAVDNERARQAREDAQPVKIDPAVVEAAIGGSYDMPDGRKFWIDAPVAREMTKRALAALEAEQKGGA